MTPKNPNSKPYLLTFNQATIPEVITMPVKQPRIKVYKYFSKSLICKNVWPARTQVKIVETSPDVPSVKRSKLQKGTKRTILSTIIFSRNRAGARVSPRAKTRRRHWQYRKKLDGR